MGARGAMDCCVPQKESLILKPILQPEASPSLDVSGTCMHGAGQPFRTITHDSPVPIGGKEHIVDLASRAANC